MDWITPGFPILHYLLEFVQAHVHWVGDVIQISFSVAPFSSRPQPFPASGSFWMIWLFTSGGQSIGTSASAFILPMNIQGWFPLWLPGLISLQSKGLLKVCILWHHNLKPSVLRHSALFMVRLSHPYMTTRKTIALTVWASVGKVMSLLFNMLSGFVIA